MVKSYSGLEKKKKGLTFPRSEWLMCTEDHTNTCFTTVSIAMDTQQCPQCWRKVKGKSYVIMTLDFKKIVIIWVWQHRPVTLALESQGEPGGGVQI